jgi:transcription initiation factor TFIIH subunit 2
MADSDGDYVADGMSDDDFRDHQVTDDTPGDARSSRGKRGGKKGDRKGGRGKAAWEDVKRSWETVTEGVDGNLAVGERLEAEKRKRLLRDTTPLQRGIIRHLMLVLDMSFAMTEKDLLPTRYRLTITYAIEFVREYFEQNPISQMGIIAMRDGVAVRISDMSGNPSDHMEQLRSWEGKDPQGNPSLQNALEMCRGALLCVSRHRSRKCHFSLTVSSEQSCPIAWN